MERSLRRHPGHPPVDDPAGDPRLDAGITLFNAGKHWHAHEEWEPLWLGLAGEDKHFMQGLIMAAAMLVQRTKDIERGVANHWRNVQARLPPHAPAKWGIDVDGLLRQLHAVAEGREEAAAVTITRHGDGSDRAARREAT